MVEYIEIRGYKSIKSERIDLRPINIFIGPNGGGKTNFISFFEFLNKLYERKLNEYIQLTGGEDKILHKGKKVTDTISFKLDFNSGINDYAVTMVLSNDGFIFTKELLFYEGNPWDISILGKESQIKHSDNYRAIYIRRYLNYLRKYHFHDTSKNSPFTKLSHIQNDAHYLYGDGSNLAAFLYELSKRHQNLYARIVKTIQSIASFFSDFYIQPNSENLVRLQWTDKYSDTIYGVADLSDGTLRFIALTVLFMQPNTPGAIILDEPELGLHPMAIAMLSRMIKSAAEKRCQIVIATQSVNLIDHFTADDVLTVDQVNGESKFKRLDNESLSKWLDDYMMGDI